jgi:hypothetical protein
MANEIFKEIKTRIALRWLDYATWSTEAFKAEKPLKGEVWFCEVPTGNANAQTAPTVLFKVGDGKNTFGDLKWGSALAADVYAWAKKATPDWADFPALPIEVIDNETGKFVTDFEYANNKLTIHRANVALNDISDKEKIALASDLEDLGRDLAQLTNLVHDNKTQLTTTAGHVVGAINEHDAEIGDLDDLNTTNKGNLVSAINEALQAVEVGGTGSVVTVTKSATPTTGSEVTYVVNQGGKAVDVKIEIPKYATDADYGVLEVKGDSVSGVVVDNTDAQRPVVKIAANTYDAHGAAAVVQGNLTAYENAHASDYTNTKIDELVQGAKDYADNNDANTEYHVEYDSTNKKIKLVAGADASKMEIDATAFIKDGMIDTVTIGEDNDLVITFNTAAGKDEIRLPLDQLVDIYTGSNGSEVNVAVSNQNVISASLTNEVATKIAHGEEAHGWGNHASQGYLKAGDIAGKANTADLGALAYKDKIVEGYIEGTIAVGKISGLGALATKDNITHELVTDFDAAVKAVKVDNATDADHADNADTADYATEAGDAEKLGGQLPGYYATKSSVDAIPGAIDEKIAAYNTSKKFGDIITHNVGEFATSAQGTKADNALQEVTTTANGGLKVTNKNQIDIDTDVVFVLDCNW